MRNITKYINYNTKYLYVELFLKANKIFEMGWIVLAIAANGNTANKGQRQIKKKMISVNITHKKKAYNIRRILLEY